MAQARRRSKRNTGRRSRGVGAHWIMLVVGLVSGVALTALYNGIRSDSDTGLGSGLKSLLSRPTAAPAPAADRTRDPAAESVPQPKPKLDFYTVLPEIERVMPDSDFVSEADATPRKPSVYILQAASYRSFADADRLKARLALEGIEAQVQKVSVEGKGVYFRVRLGPYQSKRAVKNMRQRLAKLGINALPLRLSDG